MNPPKVNLPKVPCHGKVQDPNVRHPTDFGVFDFGAAVFFVILLSEGVEKFTRGSATGKARRTEGIGHGFESRAHPFLRVSYGMQTGTMTFGCQLRNTLTWCCFVCRRMKRDISLDT